MLNIRKPASFKWGSSCWFVFLSPLQTASWIFFFASLQSSTQHISSLIQGTTVNIYTKVIALKINTTLSHCVKVPGLRGSLAIGSQWLGALWGFTDLEFAEQTERSLGSSYPLQSEVRLVCWVEGSLTQSDTETRRLGS